MESFLNTQNREKNPNPTTAGHRTAALDLETEEESLGRANQNLY